MHVNKGCAFQDVTDSLYVRRGVCAHWSKVIDGYVLKGGVWVQDTDFDKDLPIFLLEPQDVSTLDTTDATFNVSVDNADSVQWQQSSDNGLSWQNISGATGASYTKENVDIDSDNGLQFRCAATNPDGTKYSSAALLTVTLEVGLPVVGTVTTTPDPEVYGQQLILSCSVSNARTWEWHFDKKDGNGFQPTGWKDTQDYTIYVLDIESSQQWEYRIVAENVNGTTVGDTYQVPDLAPVGGSGIEPSGDSWLWDGQTKFFAGGVNIGEPWAYKQKYNANGLSINDSTDWLGTKLRHWSENGFNYFRCTMAGWLPKYTDGPMVSVEPFTGGKTSFNVNSINQEYFDRLDAFLYRCEEYGIVASIEVWDTWWCLNATNVWQYDGSTNVDSNGDPVHLPASMYWNPKNVSSPGDYTEAGTGLPEDGVTAPLPGEDSYNGLFTLPARNGDYTIPAGAETHPLLKAQKIFVDALCTVLAKHTGNAIVQIQNESVEPDSWDVFWANYINLKALGLYVCTMKDNWNLSSSDAQESLSNSAYHFGDASQGLGDLDSDSSSYNHDNLFNEVNGFVNSNGNDKPVNAVKVYSRDGGKYGYPSVSVDSFFTMIMAGLAGAAFHPGVGLDSSRDSSIGAAGLGDGYKTSSSGGDGWAVGCVRGIRIADNDADIVSMTPIPLSSSLWISRPARSAFGKYSSQHIVLYIKGQNPSFKFNVETVFGTGTTYKMRWINLDETSFAISNWSSSETSGSAVDVGTSTANRRLLIMAKD